MGVVQGVVEFRCDFLLKVLIAAGCFGISPEVIPEGDVSAFPFTSDRADIGIDTSQRVSEDPVPILSEQLLELELVIPRAASHAEPPSWRSSREVVAGKTEIFQPPH